MAESGESHYPFGCVQPVRSDYPNWPADLATFGCHGSPLGEFDTQLQPWLTPALALGKQLAFSHQLAASHRSARHGTVDSLVARRTEAAAISSVSNLPVTAEAFPFGDLLVSLSRDRIRDVHSLGHWRSLQPHDLLHGSAPECWPSLCVVLFVLPVDREVRSVTSNAGILVVHYCMSTGMILDNKLATFQLFCWHDVATAKKFRRVPDMDNKSGNQLATKLDEIAAMLRSLADGLRGTDYDLTDELASRFTAFEKADLCLHCGRKIAPERSKRGCHPGCYATLSQRISRGQATDRELVESGRMTPKGDKGGRPLKPLPPLPSLEPDQQLSADLVAEAKPDAKKLAATRKSPPNENGGRKRAKSDTDGAR